MTKIKVDRYFFIGLWVLASVLANQWANFIQWQDPLEMLWFCDFTALLLSVGLMLKNRTLITLALVSAVPAQSIWIVDFFLEAFGHGMGRTAQLWSYGHMVFWLSVNLHAILIPASLYGVWKLGFGSKALKPILVYISLLLTASFLFTPPIENRNCVFYDCDGQDPTGRQLSYFLVHSLFFWNLMMVVSFYVTRFLFRKNIYKSTLKKSEREIISKTTTS